MCVRRVRLMWPIIAAIVVVFPVPVGPVIRIRPRGEAREGAHHGREPKLLERRHLGPDTTDREADHAALTEHVDAEASDAGERVAEVGLVRLLELPLLVLAHQGVGEAVGVGGGEVAELGGRQLAVHPHEGDVARLQVEVARAPLDRVPEKFVDVHARPPLLRLIAPPRPLRALGSKHRPLSAGT